MIKEFRDFIMRGNVIDLAVAVIMGAAFTAIVNSLVQDILMPILGVITGGFNFNTLYLNLSGREYATYAEAKAAGAAVIGFGAFIQALITFFLIALSVFFMIKAVNAANRKKAQEPAPPPEPTKEEILLTEIRDLLAQQQK